MTLPEINWVSEGDAAVELLRALVQADSSNPPGNTAGAAVIAAEQLRAAGCEPEILEAAPGHVNVVARLRGDGDEPPLLLNAHLDVVPAEPHAWTYQPFAAQIADGYVWGRGTVDMKNMAAMSLAVFRMLADAGGPRRRDVIFVGVADEEAGCTNGSAWMVAEHAEKVRAGFALGEVGGFTMQVGNSVVYPVQVAEKGVCWLKATARGPAGHGSIPREDNAIVTLARFLHRVGRRKLPVHRSGAVDRFIASVADRQSQPGRTILPWLLNDRVSPLVGRVIPDRSVARTLEALVRNTVSPTMLGGGTVTNVIPSVAEAHLDGRIAIGSTAEELVAEVAALAGDSIELEIVRTHEPHEAPADTELFRTIGDVVGEHHPGAVAVPSVTPGFTDSHYWSKMGAVCYGFSPVRLAAHDPPFAQLFHAADERIPVEGFKAGLRMLADVVFRFVR
ncbi:MAG: M20/M25/M40 family metallo-hydrolase [Nitriliruptorales bacterium]|nr:M20/M25/M40 family metallo-hydrolase [Nitriliruptorales bacterium]